MKYPSRALALSLALLVLPAPDGLAQTFDSVGTREVTLEVCNRPETRSIVHYISDLVGRGLREIQADYPDWFLGIRQNGVVMGLQFAHPQGAKFVMRHLYDNGVWAIFSTLDPSVLQFKPGILLRPELCEGLLDRTEVAIRKAWADVRQASPAGNRHQVPA